MPKPDDIRVDGTGCLLHLTRAQDSKCSAALRPDGVLTTFSPCRASDNDAHAVAEPQGSEHATRLVIRMCAGIHDGQDRGQAPKLAVKAHKSGLGHFSRDTLMIPQH
jgi:hypothetical protein